MKKKKMLILTSSALCAILFSSCSTGSYTSFNANWYENTAINTIDAKANDEKLTYDVALAKDSGLNSSYKVSYTSGTYSTVLSTEIKKNSDGKDELFYSYSTDFSISVQFLFGNETSEIFKDTVTSKVLFRSIQTGLQPIYSEKKVHSHSPNGLTPVTLEACYTEYNYSVVVDYNNNGAAGTAVLTDLTKDDSSVTTNFEISQNYSYIDNEELLFAIRGMTLTAAQQVNVYNASSRAVQPVKVTPEAEKTDTFDFEIDGVGKSREITYYPAKIALAITNPGSTLTAWYAKTQPSLTNNVYRNVMLRLETPLSYNLGTLVYTLKTAQFS